MRELKRKMLRLFFIGELCVFTGIYFWGSQGLCAFWHIEQENVAIEIDIHNLRNEVSVLEHDITQWHAHAFYKEKIAREQLQMARAQDHIYYINQ